jgi:hypothetical protein
LVRGHVLDADEPIPAGPRLAQSSKPGATQKTRAPAAQKFGESMTTDALDLALFLKVLRANRDRKLEELKKQNAKLSAELAHRTILWGTTLYRQLTR